MAKCQTDWAKNKDSCLIPARITLTQEGLAEFIDALGGMVEDISHENYSDECCIVTEAILYGTVNNVTDDEDLARMYRDAIVMRDIVYMTYCMYSTLQVEYYDKKEEVKKNDHPLHRNFEYLNDLSESFGDLNEDVFCVYLWIDNFVKKYEKEHKLPASSQKGI